MTRFHNHFIFFITLICIHMLSKSALYFKALLL